MLARQSLSIFTKISFYTALMIAIFLAVSVYLFLIATDDSEPSILSFFILLSFLTSLFGIPFSIVSMFSKENLTKRIFILVVNLFPTVFIIYGFIVWL